MNRNIEGIRNTGSGDRDFEINRTRQEFAGIASAMQSARERHAQRVQDSLIQSGTEVRDAIKTYVQSVKGELSQSALGPEIRTNRFDLDPNNWTVHFHGGNKSINADEPFLIEEVWVRNAEEIINRVGDTLMWLRAHTNASLTRPSGK